MNGLDYFTLAFDRYADFSGRSRRSEYWYFVLFQILTCMGLAIFGGLIWEWGGIVAIGLFSLFSIIPSYAVLVRRLHDTGRSGWWYFISFIPLVGSILLLIWLVSDSDPRDNQWGISPKYGELEYVEDHLIDEDEY